MRRAGIVPFVRKPMKANVTFVDDDIYGFARSLLKPWKKIEVELGKHYEICSPTDGTRLFYKCAKSGVLTIRFKEINNKEVFMFGGDAQMIFDQTMTEDMCNG